MNFNSSIPPPSNKESESGFFSNKRSGTVENRKVACAPEVLALPYPNTAKFNDSKFLIKLANNLGLCQEAL